MVTAFQVQNFNLKIEGEMAFWGKKRYSPILDAFI